MVPLSKFRSVLERVLQIHAVRVSMDDDVSAAESGLRKVLCKNHQTG